MDKLSRITAEERDDLAAYLDGELDDDSTRRIETLLTDNAVARNEIEALARTYDLLNYLPRQKAPSDFTERTINTAKLETLRRPLHQQRWYQLSVRVLILAGWFVAMTAVSALGFAMSTHLVKSEDDALLNELPLIEHFDVYSEVQSIEFLRQLANEPQLLEEIAGSNQK